MWTFERCPLFKISRAWCSLPLSLRLVCSSTQWFETPEWDIQNSSILWQNLGANTDVAFADHDGCSHQGDWHGRLNYITFKLFFFQFFSRLTLQWDEAHAVGIFASQRKKGTAVEVYSLGLCTLKLYNWLLRMKCNCYLLKYLWWS